MSEASYFRVQTADRDATTLLAPGQVSRHWDGDRALDQNGVSVCADLDDLAWYLGTYGQGLPITQGDWVIVEVSGSLLGDGRDPRELLIQPTAIVNIAPLDNEFRALIDANWDDFGF